jgi:hypothetical protein
MAINKEWVRKLGKIRQQEISDLLDSFDTGTLDSLIYVGNLIIGNDYKEEIANKYTYRIIGYDELIDQDNLVADYKCITNSIKQDWNKKYKSWDEESKFILVTDFVKEYGYDALKHVLTGSAITKISNKEIDHATKVYAATLEIKQPNDKGNKEMKDTKLNKVMNDNTEVAKVAAKITAGKAINIAVLDKVKPKLPLMLQGYANTPVGQVAIANLVNFATQTYAPGNEKAAWVADAMMVAAMTEFVGQFNFEGMMADILDTVDVTIPTAE